MEESDLRGFVNREGRHKGKPGRLPSPQARELLLHLVLAHDKGQHNKEAPILKRPFGGVYRNVPCIIHYLKEG